MKVVLFANRVADPVRDMTGVGRYVQELAVALAGTGAADWALGAPRETDRPQWLPPGVSYVPAGGRWLPRRILNGAWTAFGSPRLERLVGPFDLLHVLHPAFPVPTRRPAVLSLLDLLPLEHPEWSPIDERVGLGRVLRRAVAEGWVLLPCSHYVAGRAGELLGADPARMVVAPLGVDGRFARPVPPPQKAAVCARYGVEVDRFLLAVGRVIDRKNLATVVEALGRLGPGGPPLLVAGRVEAAGASLLERASALGLSPRLKLVGFVADDELIALVQSAAALVHPSLAEGFGLTVVEAMSAGTAVIASNGASLPEIAGDAAVLVAPFDVEQWSTAIADLLADDARRHDLATRGRRRAAGFDWATTAARTLAAYRLALGDGHSDGDGGRAD